MAKKNGGETGISLEQIGVRLKSLRKERYTNYENFAYENDLNRVQYGRYENGNDMRMSTFLKILKALNVTPAEFFQEGFGK
ncbi:MAG: helix-turn-helix transcriptional regulator [Bacteroidetes bacterium]|nr:helix-turn-helix transcriptional regulator [Bacteroidota bacterium]